MRVGAAILTAALLSGWNPTAAAVEANLSRPEIRELFTEATSLFREANRKAAEAPDAARDLYRKALLRFERIEREGGIRNGRLYYNMGNACFRMEDLGRAVLNYRRAQELIPNDPNLRQNLAFARARCPDRIEETPRTQVLQTVFFWHYDLSAQVRSRLFFAAFFIFWTAALARLRWAWPALHGILVGAGLLAALLLASLVLETVARQRERPGTIVAAQVVARKGDGEAYEPSFTGPLHAGTEFRVLEDRGDWYEIELRDGRNCWVPARALALVR